jgi:hypothetical protein
VRGRAGEAGGLRFRRRWCCSPFSVARAQNFSCTASGGAWTTAGDWSSCNGTFPNNGQPSASDTYDATVAGNTTLGSAVTVGNVTIDSGEAWQVSASGDTITLNGALANSGLTEIDVSGGQGGTTVAIGGALTNRWCIAAAAAHALMMSAHPLL